jgi:hypothetical protein
MPEMKALTEIRRAAIIAKIIGDFGDGTFRPDRYVFEQITRLPSCASQERIAVNAAISRLPVVGEVAVIFDPYPQNRRFSLEVADLAGASTSPGFLTLAVGVEWLLSFVNCDMYVTTTDGDLLIVGCHEDEVVDGDRIVWCCNWRSGGTP